MINQRHPYYRWFYFLVAVILAIAIFFRFYNIDKKIYWIDEVHTSLRVAGYEKVEFAETAPAGKIITIDELHKFQRLNPERGWGDTINALAHNAEHTPIYYLITRLAMQWFGSSVAVTRGVAAAISLLVFPSMYWLCLELFQSRIVGAIALCLVAVSPLHIIYAQEARQYSLFTVTILLSSIALLKAISREQGRGERKEEREKREQATGNREQGTGKNKKVSETGFLAKISETGFLTKISAFHHNFPQKPGFFLSQKPGFYWAIYAVTVSLNLYSHLISILVLIGHGIYVFFCHRRRDFFQSIHYLLALIAGILTLIPWIVIYLLNSNKIGGWVGRDISLPTLLQRWLINLNAVFFDVQISVKQRLFDVEAGQDWVLSFDKPWVYVMPLILILVGYALYFVFRYTDKPVWLFILTLIGSTALPLMLPDIISGGQRSGIARYLIPSYVGIELAVAYAIAYHLNLEKNNPLISISHIKQKLWQGIFIALITLGIISATISAEAETWWHKYSSYYNPEVAQIINQIENPLVISPQERVSRITSLSYKLKPEAKILLIQNQDISLLDSPSFTEEINSQNLFVFRPSAELYQVLDQNPNYQLIPLHTYGHLFKLTQETGFRR
ncbi:glycosyltransferase family 39 protein [Planktothricoides raciborskii]|uniref:Glycosyltransferase family 39 protein n=2 Tax=Planktothricoides raciborskii TaxID=132608 RepID=A0AAU8JAA8_9CYAN|nr:glycosyltransferase family 39 protein [Planktothricoides raciborskii]MBD2543135.1 glycosyltransferase family 39 protein [Planktothricoides raciborskii FACHB-1370]MBD2585098.1 glycosyltransferase family 39 protein [Planktothricoides raciborskii FACHB-1261]